MGVWLAAGAVEALLAAGADHDTPAPSGKSVRELAVLNKKTAVIEVLARRVAGHPPLDAVAVSVQ